MKRACEICGRRFRYPGFAYDPERPALVHHEFWGHGLQLPTTETEIREWVSVHNEMVHARDAFWGKKMQDLASDNPDLLRRMGLDPDEFPSEAEVWRGVTLAIVLLGKLKAARSTLATETDPQRRALLQEALDSSADLESLALAARDDDPFRIDEQRQAAVKLSRAIPEESKEEVTEENAELDPPPGWERAEIEADAVAAKLAGDFIAAYRDDDDDAMWGMLQAERETAVCLRASSSASTSSLPSSKRASRGRIYLRFSTDSHQDRAITTTLGASRCR